MLNMRCCVGATRRCGSKILKVTDDGICGLEVVGGHNGAAFRWGSTCRRGLLRNEGCGRGAHEYVLMLALEVDILEADALQAVFDGVDIVGQSERQVS